MKKQKMSLSNIKDVLSRDEMKQIMAGSGSSGNCLLNCFRHGMLVGKLSMDNCSGANSGYISTCQTAFMQTVDMAICNCD